MNKTDKIFSYLPDLYRNTGKNSLVYHLVGSFAQKLQAIEDDNFEIMKSHWVNHTDIGEKKINDLRLLGSLFDIKPIEGESVEWYRRRLKKMIRIYIDGVGTTRAIIEVVAAVFGWDVCPKITLPGKTKEVDEFTTIAKMVYSGQLCSDPPNECPKKCKNFNLEIIDNPKRLSSREVKEEEVNNQFWEVINCGIYKATPSITIKASNREIKNPIVLNNTTGQGLVYVDTIAKGSILRIVPGEKAVLDDRDVSDRIFYFACCRFEEGKFNQTVFERIEKGLFGLNLPSGKFFETKFDESVFDPIEQRLSSPELPPGKTQWSAMVMKEDSLIYPLLKERFEESLFEEAVFDHSGFDVIALDLQEDGEIHGNIKLDWIERQTAAFMVRLPRNLPDLVVSSLKVSNLRELLEKEIRKVKAAGVESIIEYWLKPFEEEHEQTANFLGIDDLIPQVEEHDSGESMKIAIECALEESHPIIDSLAVASEISTKELQSQEDKFGVKIEAKWTQPHEQMERLSVGIEAREKEEHLMKDSLVFSGIFGVTYFDTAYFVATADGR